ncbi:MAG TPA: ATP12 family protein [Pseudolabrys sp.]|jgi:chaperone required for assembly of F1-ATPase|nr:ATP12 family protein [Pseudolabrys sp.]
MRDLFTEIFENQPLDPTEAARKGARPHLHKRFYERARAGDGGAVLLDGKPVRTPARRALAAPTPALAKQLAAEWDAQTNVIDPLRMPLTRLANATIDTVRDDPQPVADEIAKYLSADLLFYRAEGPHGLVEKQSQAWDPVLTWAQEALGARFVLAQGVVHVTQPGDAVAAARGAIPMEPWQLAATSSITTLTGSALLALALARGALDADGTWAATHVDEDWQMSQWGRDELALERRAYRRTEFDAAVTVLRLAG